MMATMSPPLQIRSGGPSRPAGRTLPSSWLLPALAGALCWVAPVRAGCPPDAATDLTSIVTTTIADQDWQFHHTIDTNRPNYVSTSKTLEAVFAAQTNYAELVDHLNFLPPYVSTLPEVNVYLDDIPNSKFAGLDRYGCIELDSVSWMSKSELYNRQVLLHETFHAIQRAYVKDVDGSSDGGTFLAGGWAVDGTAVAIQDRADADGDSYDSGVSFESRVQTYLGNPDVGFFDGDGRYEAGAFWSYLCEQLGTHRLEPEYGYDFIWDYWRLMQSGDVAHDGLQALRDNVRDHGGTSLEDLFHDFSICCYTHSFTNDFLRHAEKYRFVDDPDGQTYRAVATTLYTNLPAGGGRSLDLFATDYLEASAKSGSCHAVGARVKSVFPMGCALVSERYGWLTDELSKNVSDDYFATFLSYPSIESAHVCLIVANLNSSVYSPDGFRYAWTIAEGDLDLTVVRPDSAHVQHAGPHDDPHPILVRVYVEGPEELKPDGYGLRSVKGLHHYKFSAVVGTNAADVLLAGYVGNEYQLVVQPPKQDADGLYPLGIGICAEHVWHDKAVQYGDEILRHVVVVDNSGSMDAPAGSTKLEAAKNAAALYLYCVPESEHVGLVSFSGNGSECNDDAVDRAFGLDPATEFKKLACNLALYGMAPSNRTSIGDGLMLAQDLLETAPPTNDCINNIVLLSDGKENEELYWALPGIYCATTPVSQRILATNTHIQAIALGPSSDQGLMANIGETTGGDFTYIDVEDSVLRRSASRKDAGAAPQSLANRLCDAYLAALQKVRRLERLGFVAKTVAAESTISVDFPVLEGGVEEPLFFFAWDGADDAVDVALYDPASNLVEATSATILTGAHQRVYFVNSAIGTGTWSAVIEGASACELIGGLLGRPTNDVFASVAFSQAATGGSSGACEDTVREQFEEGVPITILAFLADHAGPVTNAAVNIRIVRPDGSVVCGPGQLRDDGAHDDGEADDGVYGLIFTQTAEASTGGLDLDAAPATPAGTNAGTYTVELSIHGTAAGGEFDRLRTAAFHVYRRIERDADFDGIPDTWEVFYGTSPTNAADAAEDADRDGLTNLAEFQAGTHPFNPDTDFGGESDASEIAAGLCPFDPADDRLPIPIDVEAVEYLGDTRDADMLHPLAILLRYPVSAAYDAMRIYRDSSPTGTFPLLTEIALTNPAEYCYYYDEGLTDGDVWHYSFQGVTSAGAVTPLSRLVHGTARLHPVPPIGNVMINNGNETTDSLDVLLRLRASDDVAFYRIGTNRFSGSEPWLAYTNEYVACTLAAPVATPGQVQVYAQYLNVWSNSSESSGASILYDPLGDADGDLAANNADPDGDDDGLADGDEVFTYHTDPFNADTDGDGLDDGVEIANYGSDPRLDDTDSDGLSDADELAEGTGIADPDSDGDGLLDGWEVRYDFNPLVGGEELVDSDGDGENNLDEQTTGSDPTDPASVFAVVAGTPCDPGELELVWPSLPERTYRIEVCNDLENPSWSTVETVSAVGSQTRHVVACPTENVLFFYTIRLLP